MRPSSGSPRRRRTPPSPRLPCVTTCLPVFVAWRLCPVCAASRTPEFILYNQSRQPRPVKRPPSLEAPLQPSLSLSCATLARPCRCALPPNRRAPPPNTPTRRAARHPDGRPDPHFRLRAHASASRAAELIAAGIVGSSSETRGSAGTFRHGTYHGTSERGLHARATRLMHPRRVVWGAALASRPSVCGRNARTRPLISGPVLHAPV